MRIKKIKQVYLKLPTKTQDEKAKTGLMHCPAINLSFQLLSTKKWSNNQILAYFFQPMSKARLVLAEYLKNSCF